MVSRESEAAGKIPGTVEAIFIAPSAGEPMQVLLEVEAIAGLGLAGDRYLEGTGYYSDRPLADGSRETEDGARPSPFPPPQVAC